MPRLSRKPIRMLLIAVVSMPLLPACGGGSSAPPRAPIPDPVLDPQNALDCSLGGQGSGRFGDVTDDPLPRQTSFDFQDAQTFTVGVKGELSGIRIACINTTGATESILVTVVRLTGNTPDTSMPRGSVSVPAPALPTDFNAVDEPTQWATADFGFQTFVRP